MTREEKQDAWLDALDGIEETITYRLRSRLTDSLKAKAAPAGIERMMIPPTGNASHT